MLRFRPKVSKSYEFETTDVLYFYKFLDVIEHIAEIHIIDKYLGSTYDYHNIKFVCDPKTRLKTEYIFRRFVNLRKMYLLDQDTYQNRQLRYREENYEIF